MTSDRHAQDLVSMAEIARMAGQSRSTVGNWKRRYAESFPPERGRTSRGPLYDRSEVLAWLASRDTQASIEDNADLWSIFALLRDRSPNETLAVVLVLLYLSRQFEDPGVIWTREGLLSELDNTDSVPVPLRDAVTSAIEAIDQKTLDLLCRQLATVVYDRSRVAELARHAIDLAAQAAGGRAGEYSTPPSVVTLMAQLAGPGATIYDPCAGTGQLLAAVANLDPDLVQLAVGQDLSPMAAAIAKMNLAIQGTSSNISVADTLTDDAQLGFAASRVVAAPPLGQRLEQPGSLANDPRWLYGEPTVHADGLWLQVALHHLADEGRAVILASPGSILFPSGNSGLMLQRIIKANLVDAVIALPGGLLDNSGMQVVVVVLSKGRSSSRSAGSPGNVLLIDARDARVRSTKRWQRGLDDEAILEIVATYRDWVSTAKVNGTVPAVSVSYGELAGNDFVLEPRRYIHAEHTPSIDAIAERQRSLAGQLRDLADTPSLATASEGEWTPDLLGANPSPALPVRRLDHIAAVVRGVNPSQVSDTGDVPVRNVRSLLSGDEPSGYLQVDAVASPFATRPGDVIIVIAGPHLGVTRLVEGGAEPFAPGHDLALVRVEADTNDPRFLQLWMTTTAFQAELQRLSTGTTIRRLAMRSLAGLSVPCPPHEVQRAIADHFEAVDGAIQAQEHRLRLLADKRSADLDALAVTLDPVESWSTR